MPIPLIPIVIGSLAATAAFKVHQRSNAMTPERQKLFDAAIQALPDPEKLRKLADAFQQQGLSKQADLLRKRAALRELPEATKQARKEVFIKTMNSTDPDKVEQAAAVFHGEGCIGAAAVLKLYAEGLRSTDPAQVEAIATSLENKKGESGKAAAKKLRAK
jgi:phosphopentomutase